MGTVSVPDVAPAPPSVAFAVIAIEIGISLLAADPFAANNNVRKLVGHEAYRLRVGDWRVIYEIEGGRLVIHVLTVAPRGGAYQ